MANRKDSKGRVLRTGETERSDGRYSYRYTDKKTGKRKEVYARDLPELRAKEKEVLLDMENNIRTDGSIKKLTVNGLFKSYLDTKEISESTKANYRCTWENHIKNTVGEYKVIHLLPSDIKKLYAGMAKAGYSRSMIKLVHHVLYPVLKMAVDDDIIHKNPAKSVVGDYGYAPKEKKALTRGQQKKLMEFVESSSIYHFYFPMLTVMLGTGVRCGELVGLTWNDVDMEKKEIHIRRTLIYEDFGDGLKFHVSTPKTKSGIRTIPMTDRVHTAFEKQKQLNSLLGRNGQDFEVDGCRDFIFVTGNSRPFVPTSVNKVLYRIVKAINTQKTGQETAFPSISAHTMRHTFCTRMAENGMDIKVLQYLMGHASVNITMQTYNHIADSSRIEKELKRIDELAVNF